MPDISFNSFFDPQKKTTVNLFDAVASAGRVLAAGAQALVHIKEALSGFSTGSGVNLLSILSSLMEENRKNIDKLVTAIDELTKMIEETGKETLTSEIVARVREDNERLESTIEKMKMKHQEELRQKEFTQTVLAMPGEDAEKFLRPILDEMLSKMLEEKRANGGASS